MHSQGGETSIQDSYSRWGVKGSNEVSEGLTAVYRYEEGLDLAITTLRDNNRLSYVGLSGGFGTVTMGRIWSASYNHLGALTDTGIHNAPNTSTSGRTSNALSYSASTGPVSFQIDANMNEKEESKRSVDMAQLGMSFDTGAAKIGLAFANSKTKLDSTRMSGIGVSVPVGGLNLYGSWTQKKVTTFKRDSAGDGIVIPGQKRIEIAAQTGGEVGGQERVEPVSETPDRCLIVRYENAKFGGDNGDDKTKFVRDSDLAGPTPTTGGDIVKMTLESGEVVDYRYTTKFQETAEYKAWNDGTATTGTKEGTFNVKNGIFENRIPAPTRYHCGEHTEIDLSNGNKAIVARIFQSAVQEVEEVQAEAPITIADQSGGLIEGHKEFVIKKESYSAHPGGSVTTRHMHAGVSGPLGDTGMSFAVNFANHPESKDGIGENPWNFNVSKSLGGGASLAFEYVDYDEEYDDEALLRLKVDF